MTLFGKILLLVNLVLSLMFAAIALGVYTNHVDWAVGTATDPGEFAKKKQEVSQEQAAALLALSRWQKNLVLHGTLEMQRPQSQQWYARQLAILEGKDAAGQIVQGPIQVLVYKAGVLDLDRRTGLPVFGAPAETELLSRTASEEAAIKTEKDIRVKLQEIEELTKKETELTLEVNGEKGKQKGLRDLLQEGQDIEIHAKAEIENLKPLLYNRLDEADRLQRREAALSARKQELVRLGMANREP